MSLQPEIPSDDNAMEQHVSDYLSEHPDFFERHPELLLELRLPHASGGTISLVERQLMSLRDQCDRYRKKLENLINTGRANDLLIQRLHRLTLSLIDTVSLDEVLNVLEDHLHDQFQADAVELRLFAHADLKNGGKGHQDIELFRSIFDRGVPLCGRLTRQQLEYLFGDESEEMKSAALIPLRSECVAGLLAIGSSDEHRFQCDMSTDFLHRLGEVVSKRLEIVSEPGF